MRGKRRPTAPYYTPSSPVQPTLTTHKPLTDMGQDESTRYLEQLMDRLRKKQQRERNYLDRRARRGTRTPTDEIMEEDQRLLDETLSVLEQGLQGLREASP